MQEPKAFWKCITREVVEKQQVSLIGDSVGKQKVCDMWKKQFSNQ